LPVEAEKLKIMRQVRDFLHQQKIKAFLVGGFVRDCLIERGTEDIDLAVHADALKTAQEMSEALRGKFVPLDEEHGIARVVFFPESDSQGQKQKYVDLSSITGSIEDDLSRRDFTINSMAASLDNYLETVSVQTLLDPFHGQEDLENRQLRAVSPGVFLDDPLRLLRAFRLAAELDLTIVPETEELIRRYAGLIIRVSGERIHEELVRIFSSSRTGYIVRCMDNLGLLTVLIPELESGRETEQPQEHHWKVLDHAIETVAAAGFIIRHDQWVYGDAGKLAGIPWSDELAGYFNAEVTGGSTRAALLKLAALLHDIAKPDTRIFTGERIRFFGHDKQGADVVKAVLERLRFSNKEIDLVEKMVRFHMRPTQLGGEEAPSRRAVFRYFRDTGNAGIDVLFLSLADHLAARGPDLDHEQWRRHVGQSAFLLNEYENKNESVAQRKLIDGNDIIQLFGLPPGPKIRQLLDLVREAQADGEVTNREEALSYIKNRILLEKAKNKEVG
jgi:poly(A) polymerase